MLEYKEFLLKNLVTNNKIACEAYLNLPFDNVVIFDTYYNETIIKELFNRYLTMIYNTLNFIYSNELYFW
jgi:hypothetical protein